MPWPEYSSLGGSWGDPGRYKPSQKNLEAARAYAAFNDILASRDEAGGPATLGTAGKIKINQQPVAFFAFWFQPFTGTVISGINSEGNNVRGYLPAGYSFEQVTDASYVLRLPADEEIKSNVMVTAASTTQFVVTSQWYLLNSQTVRIRLLTHAVGSTGRRAFEPPPAGSYVGVAGFAARYLCHN